MRKSESDADESGFHLGRRMVVAGLLTIPALVETAENADGATYGGSDMSQEPLYKQPFTAFQGKSLEQKVQELADREEIRELISRYAHCVAHGVSVANMFTDDGAFIVHRPGHPDEESRGRDALIKSYARLETPQKNRQNLPMIHNYLISISGNDGVGLCSNELRITEDGKSIIASGYYDDKYRRENGRWKFVVREATFFHWVPIQQGWASSPKPE